MGNLSSINFKNNRILLSLEISKDEYNLFKGEKELVVMPANSMDITLVTGTLGNSNRIMLPNKVLKKHNIETLVKHAPSKIVKTKKGTFLVIQLEGPEDVPKFKVS